MPGKIDTQLLDATWPGLANLSQSILAGLGGRGFRNAFHFERSPATCLLLLDGLGWQLLRQHASHAPFLTSLMQPDGHFKVGFPATTAASLAAVSSGMASGAHGIVGCSFALDASSELSPLSWSCTPLLPDVAASAAPDPESFIVPQTAWAQAREQGIAVSVVMQGRYAQSDFTRAIYRAARILPAADYAAYPGLVRDALAVGGPAFCFAYFGDLDFAGHLFGPGSPAWLEQLQVADRLACDIARNLPPSVTLMVTADHGMLELDPGKVRDFDNLPELQEGVLALAGDIRARHVYVQPGVHDRVHDRWQTRLGDDYRVLSKGQAIAAGLFGDVVLSQAEARIGDLIVVPVGRGGIVRTSAEPHASRWRGHHGALADGDQVVPLLVSSGLA